LQSILKIPPEIFIDIDAIFGYCEMTKTENNKWDVEFFDHLYEWVNRNSKEVLFGLDTTFDFLLSLEN
jgi:hypothetical protein